MLAQGAPALFAGRGGGASRLAQWSLNPDVPPAPSWSSTLPFPQFWLAGMQNTGLGPAPRALAPRQGPLVALSPHLYANLQLPALPLLWARPPVSPPLGLGGSSPQDSSVRADLEASLAGTPCVCF